MTRCGNLTGKTRKFFSNPAQDEECSPNAMLAKNLQHPHHVPLDPGLVGIPVIETYVRSERFHMKIIFHVDGQDIQHDYLRSFPNQYGFCSVEHDDAIQ